MANLGRSALLWARVCGMSVGNFNKPGDLPR